MQNKNKRKLETPRLNYIKNVLNHMALTFGCIKFQAIKTAQQIT